MLYRHEWLLVATRIVQDGCRLVQQPQPSGTPTTPHGLCLLDKHIHYCNALQCIACAGQSERGCSNRLNEVRGVRDLCRTGNRICSKSRIDKLHDLQRSEDLASSFLVDEDKNVIFSMKCRAPVGYIAIPGIKKPSLLHPCGRSMALDYRNFSPSATTSQRRQLCGHDLQTLRISNGNW